MAEWIVDGAPEWDLWALDPRRYTGYATQSYVRAKALELYQHEYAIAFPFEERPAGRPAKTTPLYQTLAAKGASFGARGGWERATWFAGGGRAGGAALSFGRGNWHAAVAEECRAVRERVGVLDLGGFAKLEVEGEGAAAFLDRLICGRLPQVGRVALAYMCSPKGRPRSASSRSPGSPRTASISAAPPPPNGTTSSGSTRSAGRTRSVAIENVTPRYGTLVLAGPRAREVLGEVTDGRSRRTRLPLARGAPARDRLRPGAGAAHQLRRRARLGAARAARAPAAGLSTR